MRRMPGLLAMAMVLGAACGGSTGHTPGATSTPNAENTPTGGATPTVEVTATAATETTSRVRIERDLVYATRVRDGAPVTLDLYVPADPAGAPIVVPATRSTVGGLVDAGAIVVTFDEDDHLGPGPDGPEEVLSDRAFMRSTPETYACAIHLARARAAALGSDDPVVVVTGLSFGGGAAAHVALLGDTLDTRWDEFAEAGGPPRQWNCEVRDGSTHVDAVVGMAGTYDLFVPIIDGAYGRAYQQAHDPGLQAFLADVIGANPALKVRLIHGTYDDIPVDYVSEFAGLLADAGYDVQLATFPGGHVEPPSELFLSTVLGVSGS